MSTLFHCIYTSVQTRPLSAAQIAKLIQDSRVKNEAKEITGLLLHVRDTFFQVLEGPQEVLDALWSSIQRDERHTKVTRIIYEPIPRRYFADCTMNLSTLSPVELTKVLDQDSDDLRKRLLAAVDEGRAKRLIRAFSEGRWRSNVGGMPRVLVRA